MTAENTQEIERLRKEIDAVDREIVGCIVRRSQLAQSVGKAKGTAPVYRPEREREVVERGSRGKPPAGRPFAGLRSLNALP